MAIMSASPRQAAMAAAKQAAGDQWGSLSIEQKRGLIDEATRNRSATADQGQAADEAPPAA